MRSLFISEKHCISKIMHEKWGVALHSEPVVLNEHSSDPTRAAERPNFNCDFTLDFVEDFTEWREREGTMNTALPNTLGTDLYLFIETQTMNPLHFELMFGEAFSIKHYAPYIERVEEAVKDAVLSQQLINKRSQQVLLRCIPLKKSACARILVVGGDVCFLYFPREAVPVKRGSRFDLVESDDRQIVYYLDGDRIVCFDGWIRMEVANSDRVLVAQPEGEP